MTRDEWAAIAATIHEAYDRPVKQGWVDAWYPILARFSAEVVAGAFGQHMSGSEGRFMPNGGHLAQIAMRMLGETDDFDQAWEELAGEWGWIRRYGAWATAEERALLSEPAAAIVRAMGGFEAVALWEVEGLATIRAQARMMHHDQAARRRAQGAMRALEEGPPRREIEP